MINYIRTSFGKRKKIIQFLVCLFIMGIVVGIIFYLKQGDSNKESILNSMSFFSSNIENRSINNILIHIIILIIVAVLSFLVVGIPLAITYLFYEGFSIGFSLTVFIATYKFSGFIYGVAFNLVSKLFFIVLLIAFVIKIIDIGRNIIGSFIYKNDKNIKANIIFNSKTLLVLIGIFIINDIVIYFFGSKLINFFGFLIT